MWSRGYDHFVMRQAATAPCTAGRAVARGLGRKPRPGRQVHAELRDAGAEISATQGALTIRTRLLFGGLPGSRRRADRGGASLDELPDAGRAGARARPWRHLCGYFFKPQVGQPPIRRWLLHGSRQPRARDDRPCAARPRPLAMRSALALACAAGWAPKASEPRLRQPLDVLADRLWLGGRWWIPSGWASWRLMATGRRCSCSQAAGQGRRFLLRPTISPNAGGQSVRARSSRRSVRPEGLPVRSPILRVAQIEVPVLLDPRRSGRERRFLQTTAMAASLKSHGKDVETLIVQGARISSRSSRTPPPGVTSRLPAPPPHPELAVRACPMPSIHAATRCVFKSDPVAKADVE